jgi:hypothetical protein
MPNNLFFDGLSAVNRPASSLLLGLGRAPILVAGVISDVDSDVSSRLEKLNRLLAKKIIPAADDLSDGTILSKNLSPEQVPDKWEPGSIVEYFHSRAEGASKSTLSDYIEKDSEASNLKYQFLDQLARIRDTLDFNIRTLLSDQYPAIRDYLIAYAYYVRERTEIAALTDYILRGTSGAKQVVSYAVVSAARAIVHRDQRNVPDFNKDNSDFVERIKASNLSFSATSFNSKVRALIDEIVLKREPTELIKDAEATLGPIPADIKSQLIKYIENSPIPITKQNNEYFLPLFISQIKGLTDIADTTEADVLQSAKDFEVQFLQDDNERMQVSRMAVLCAAQLYYGMVLGEELEIFNVVNYFTHKYLIRGEFEIEDSRLRKDLQMYVFSNRFTDIRTKKVVDRTRPAERQMFYRQVFNERKIQVPENLIINREYPKLWKVLMLESARCLEWLRESYNPESFVSKQNVMQAVEDLQYNLSTHCTGMSNVITPLIYAELDFVIRRIFQHPEVIRQTVAQNGTWWRVVEKLYMEMKHRRPKATVLYNKARLGYDIIKSIADYDATTFEDIKVFKAFLSTVEAFITTQSILQEALVDDLKKEDSDQDEMETDDTEKMEIRPNGHRPSVPVMAGAPDKNGASDDWDF